MMNARFDVHSSQMYLICRVVSNRYAEGFIDKVEKNQLKTWIDFQVNIAMYSRSTDRKLKSSYSEIISTTRCSWRFKLVSIVQ